METIPAIAGPIDARPSRCRGPAGEGIEPKVQVGTACLIFGGGVDLASENPVK
jgi:hypothetical protein